MMRVTTTQRTVQKSTVSNVCLFKFLFSSKILFCTNLLSYHVIYCVCLEEFAYDLDALVDSSIGDDGELFLDLDALGG